MEALSWLMIDMWEGPDNGSDAIHWYKKKQAEKASQQYSFRTLKWVPASRFLLWVPVLFLLSNELSYKTVSFDKPVPPITFGNGVLSQHQKSNLDRNKPPSVC